MEPWNNARRFRPMPFLRLIIVRKRAVKGILSRREFHRNVIAAVSRIRIIDAAVVFGPLRIPTAYAIWNRVLGSRLLANPKDCCYDLFFPREALSWLTPLSCQLAGRECERSNIERTLLT